jgi:hypothetical protein
MSGTHTHSALTYLVQIVKRPSDCTWCPFSPHQVHPGSHKPSLRPTCNYKARTSLHLELIPRRGVILEKLTVPHLNKTIPSFMDSHNFGKARKSPSLVRILINKNFVNYLFYFFNIHWMLCFHLFTGLPKGCLPFRLSEQNVACVYPFSCACCITSPAHPPWFDRQWQEFKLWITSLSPDRYINRCAGGQNWFGTTTFHLSNDTLHTAHILRL